MSAFASLALRLFVTGGAYVAITFGCQTFGKVFSLGVSAAFSLPWCLLVIGLWLYAMRATAAH